MKRFILISALILSGCSTSYQPSGFSGGYTDSQLDENVFKVSFSGNAYTGIQQSKDFALLRSAEVTFENGFKYFQIIELENYTNVSKKTYPSSSSTTTNTNTNASIYDYGDTARINSSTRSLSTTTTMPAETHVSVRPRSNNTIMCFKEKPEGFSYNAELIIQSIKKSYGIR